MYIYTHLKDNSYSSQLEYELRKQNLKYIIIHFDTPVFEKITKDTTAKFVDQLSAIGGTMGLLTGFSIISGVEIIYFSIKIAFNLFRKRFSKEQ